MNENNKHIKKIDEFLNIDNNFTFDEDDRILTNDEIEKIRIKSNNDTQKTIEKLGIRPTNSLDRITIDDYREQIKISKERGRGVKSDDELNDYCLKRFGETFYKK